MTLITPSQAGHSPTFLPLIGQLRIGREARRPRTRPDAVRSTGQPVSPDTADYNTADYNHHNDVG